MKSTTPHRPLAAIACAVALAAPALHAQTSDRPVVSYDVHQGKVAFDVTTNVPALGVHGKSANLEGRARVRRDRGTLILEAIEAAVPVSTLDTGLALRDEHMKKYVFTTGEGKQPDVRFSAAEAACPAVGTGQGTCQVSGELSIRGVSRPFTMALKLSESRGGFRAGGDGVVRLSTYGIDRPSQFGVTTSVVIRRVFPSPLGSGGAMVHCDVEHGMSTLLERITIHRAICRGNPLIRGLRYRAEPHSCRPRILHARDHR